MILLVNHQEQLNGSNLRPKWRLKLDLSAHKLEVLTIRLVCEPPHLRLIHPFISTNFE